jgi:hypothetical protein
MIIAATFGLEPHPCPARFGESERLVKPALHRDLIFQRPTDIACVR